MAIRGGDEHVARLNGDPTYVGTIDATTSSKTNATATTPFTLEAGQTYLLQADGGGVFWKSSSPAVVATSHEMSDKDSWFWRPKSTTATVVLAAITESGTASLKVFKMVI